MALPLKQRRLDLVLVVMFSGFAVSSLLFDRVSGMTRALEESDDFFAPMLVRFAQQVDPLLLQASLSLQVMSWISAFIFGPFYIVLVWALVTGRDWIRVPALLYGGAMLYSMVVHIAMEFLGDTPPLNTWIFLLTYLPYAVAPSLLIWRMRGASPFKDQKLQSS